jgi:hypothetical protein
MATTRKPRTKKTTTAKAEIPSKAVSSVTSNVTTITTRAVDIQDVIRNRAYELFEQRGCQHGAHVEDWLRAEREVLSTFQRRTA